MSNCYFCFLKIKEEPKILKDVLTKEELEVCEDCYKKSNEVKWKK